MAPKYAAPESADHLEGTPVNESKPLGCRVSVLSGFILLLLAAIVVVGVGFIVHFAGGRQVTCHCENSGGSSLTAAALEQQCVTVIKQSGGGVMCDACPVKEETTSAAPSTPSPPTEEPRDYRLPANVRPYLYTVELQPDIYGGENKDFDFKGNVKVVVTAEKSTDKIVLHAYYTLNVTETSFRVVDVNTSAPVSISHTSYERRTDFLAVHLSQALVVGHHYEIYVEFHAPLATDGIGLFLDNYMEDGKKIFLVATHMEAVRARRVFPCFDEPALKAQFDITLLRRTGVERNYTTLTNTPRLRTEPRGNGWVADVYERTVVMPTYLLAFVVCDYTYLENNASHIVYRTWAMPKRLQLAKKSQAYGVELFNKYSEYFKPAYPLTKMDNIVIPNFRLGAMENWGLTMYKSRVLYEPGVSTGADEDYTAEVISHEITHQWFGNLVSPKWWNWLWLNEAFASFWDFYIVGELYPSYRKLDMNVLLGVQTAMNEDSVRTSHPMTPNEDSVQTPSEIRKMFSDVTYRKGSAVVRMMHLAMGHDLFIKGLNRYLRSHPYGNAEHEDLWNALNEEARANSVDLNIRELMDPWVTQMNFPVVNVAVGSGRVTLTQQRFLRADEDNAEHDTAKYGYKWTIPITFTTSNYPNFTTEYIYNNVHYMTYTEDEMVLDVNIPSRGWILVNLQHCGFFHVNYDVTSWNNIIDFLKNNDHKVIHPINRAQIINDAWKLAKAGKLDMAIALNTANYLSKEEDYIPWRAFSRELEYVEDMLEQTDLYGNLKKFMDKSVTLPMERLGITVTENMIPFKKTEIAHMVGLACKYDHVVCVDNAVHNFNMWMNDSSVNPLLDMSLDSTKFEPSDIDNIIVSVANNRWGREIAWSFLTYNLGRLSSVINSTSAMDMLIQWVTRKFNTERELNKIQTFMRSGEDVSVARNGFEKAIMKTQSNIDWLKKNYAVLSSWLLSQ